MKRSNILLWKEEVSTVILCDINKGVSYGEEKRFRIIPLTDNFATITAQ